MTVEGPKKTRSTAQKAVIGSALKYEKRFVSGASLDPAVLCAEVFASVEAIQHTQRADD